ncbi:HigA family addiction module antitoxin [Ralstonia pseudosolanacearum]|uniref:HigA family addiction module antitoxin n=1 Tax=Ralstonia pseudosolanacearum TaxID=1310165 RepID=UPI003394D1E2
MDEYKTPGQLIEALLGERGWTQRLLAAVLDMSESTTNKLISGSQAVTAEIALVLEEVFGVPAERFLTLQKDYDLARARLVVRPDQGRATRAKLFSGLPVADMIKRGWLDSTDIKNMPAMEESLAKFFGAPTINEIEFLSHAAKKTDVGGDATPSQLAWLYRVRQIAKEVLAPAYSEDRTRLALHKLKSYLSAPEEARHVPRVLIECGIRLVFVEGLKGSKIDGACFWLNEKSPVIGMTLRYDRMDNFWFVLRHELEHVLQGHGQAKPILDVDLNAEQSIEQEERIANEAASEFCAPKAKIDSFIARKAPLFPERDFLGLVKILGVHPSLVAGQIQFKTGRYELFRGHLAKIRACVLPSAIVDGWGDIAPVS